MERKRCFVISPIGAEASEVREHADDVFDFIIKPAIEECNVLAQRADQLRDPGRITDQMFTSILEGDFCIAVLTGHNPNVFYEVAVAQAAGKPVVILMQKQEELPFDIKDLRCVYYDLKPRPLQDGDYKRELVDHIQSLEKREWRAESLLARYGQGMESDIRPMTDVPYEFFETSGNYGKEKDWQDLLDEAGLHLDILGVALTEWRKTPGFKETVLAKATNGCAVRILLMHQDNEILGRLLYDDRDLDSVRHDIVESHGYYSRLAAERPNVEVRQIRQGIPHFFLTRTDEHAVIIQYLSSATWGSGPTWRCPGQSKLYNVAVEEFEYLWEAGTGSPTSG